MAHQQPAAMSHSANGLFVSVVAVVTISCLLPNTAAGTPKRISPGVAPKFFRGSCLQYGHSCWGAHGKRSNIAPLADLVQPEVSLAAPADDSPASWEPPEDASLEQEAVLAPRDPWQRLRRPLHLDRLQTGSRQRDEDDVDYGVPPPRWIYKIMRQTANN
ncbi:uncharacterized protein CCHa1 [Cloeon dipterum]|uniref:uncharacterized protein CCHa1 n=1 Tax=Cloeon dipterum TaxID=197152 RepID=UPI00321FD91F